MENIKSYLKAIQLYEEQNNCFALLLDYLKVKKSTLPKLYCEGGINLPSFMLIRKIRHEYKKHSQFDPELNRLFESAMHRSKLFYLKLVALVVESRSSTRNFDDQFEGRIQPLGQQLINLITNIKYRIKLVESEKKREDHNRFMGVSKKVSYFGRIVYGFLNNLMYKMTLLQSTHPVYAKVLYYFSITSIIMLFWSVNSLVLSNKISPMACAFLNIVSGIGVVVIGIITYPIGDFGRKDISGRNNVAYIYKLFLNNHANLRMYSVFPINPSINARQSPHSEVEF